MDKIILKEDDKFQWFLNIYGSETKDTFNILPNEKFSIRLHLLHQ